jgi:hypothetical protein
MSHQCLTKDPMKKNKTKLVFIQHLFCARNLYVLASKQQIKKKKKSQVSEVAQVCNPDY